MPAAIHPGSILSRNDRFVRRARLRINSGAPVHRLTFTIEEALRLCSLPGESNGRVYYFERVSVRGLPENGDRHAWLDAFQNVMLGLARNAVHGLSAAARHANAVYFHNQQEACQALLLEITGQHRVAAWFSPAISDSAPGASVAAQITNVISILSHSDAGWLAVATVVFELPDPIAILTHLPDDALRQWLHELGGTQKLPASDLRVQLRGRILQAVGKAASVLGREDPRVVWLVSLAVILACPAVTESRTAVGLALLILRTIPTLVSRQKPDSSPPFSRQTELSPHREYGERLSVGQQSDSLSPLLVESAANYSQDISSNGAADLIAQPESPLIAPRESCFGEPTAGAGLYFLLNALKHFKIGTRQSGPPFFAHFLQHAAHDAEIENDDPILLWAARTAANDTRTVDERLLNVWIRRVRRWCWKNGKLSMREIVRRPGRVTLTRTHLDVSLSLESADIRIRRIGLDLDPGWLPELGLVVSFHYLYRGELDG